MNEPSREKPSDRVCCVLVGAFLVRNWCCDSGRGAKIGLSLLKQLTPNHRVPGSSPGAPTSPFKSLAGFTV